MSCESQINYFTMKHIISLRDSYIGMTWYIGFSSGVDQIKICDKKKNVDDMLGGG